MSFTDILEMQLEIRYRALLSFY